MCYMLIPSVFLLDLIILIKIIPTVKMWEGVEVITAVVMNSWIVWNITPC
jgi:hypothetical protein